VPPSLEIQTFEILGVRVKTTATEDFTLTPFGAKNQNIARGTRNDEILPCAGFRTCQMA
jgi:hypothetical protein